MSKRIFFNLFGIFALLLMVNHIVHFVNPLLRISSSAELPKDGNDLTTLEFIDLAQYYEEYDWNKYEQDDFEDWLYMPETYPSDVLNQSENDPIPPFYGYNWDNYDTEDFPNWLDLPDTLPNDFNATDPEYVQEFIFSHIDEEFMDELENTFNAEENAITMVVSPFVYIYQMIYALIWMVVAIIALILGRSVD